MKATFKIIEHFEKDSQDEDGDFIGDYHYVTVEDAEGKELAEFGSHYDDKGFEKAEGFCVGFAAGHKYITSYETVKEERGDSKY